MHVSICNTLFLTHLSRMVSLRGRIDLSRRWPLAWWSLNIFHQSFGMNQSIIHPIYRIGFLKNILMESLLSNLGVDTSLICLTLGFLALKLGLEFHQKRGRIWNPKVKSDYLLGIDKIPKVIIWSTWALKNPSLKGVFSLKKIPFQQQKLENPLHHHHLWL